MLGNFEVFRMLFLHPLIHRIILITYGVFFLDKKLANLFGFVKRYTCYVYLKSYIFLRIYMGFTFNIIYYCSYLDNATTESKNVL